MLIRAIKKYKTFVKYIDIININKKKIPSSLAWWKYLTNYIKIFNLLKFITDTAKYFGKYSVLRNIWAYVTFS